MNPAITNEQILLFLVFISAALVVEGIALAAILGVKFARWTNRTMEKTQEQREVERLKRIYNA